jgi:hypothetical protein
MRIAALCRFSGCRERSLLNPSAPADPKQKQKASDALADIRNPPVHEAERNNILLPVHPSTGKLG